MGLEQCGPRSGFRPMVWRAPALILILATACIGVACSAEPPGSREGDDTDPSLGSYNPTPVVAVGGDSSAPDESSIAADGSSVPTAWPLPPDGMPDRDWLRDVAGIRPLAELEVPHPPNNPPSPEREALGRLLFFDPILGGERDVSCATCHHPDFGWGDGRARGVGVGGGDALSDERRRGFSAVDGMPLEETARNSPTVLNTAFAGRDGPEPHFLSTMFWEGRVDKGLEAQALLPLGSADEMAGHAFAEQQAVGKVVARLREIDAYQELFIGAFPEQAGSEPITASTLARALAAFQRSLIATGSPFDLWLAGDDDALDPSALRGLALFAGEAGCLGCHHGPMLSDYRFHAIGARQEGPGRPLTRGYDRGRFDVTGDEADLFAFRTPTLRSIADTGPYGHAGTYATLEEIVLLHLRVANDGGLDPAQIDPLLRPVDLDDAQVSDIVAFLESLSGIPPAVEVPEAVPSGLRPIVGLSEEPGSGP